MPGNPYDCHTLAQAIEQVSILTNRILKTIIVDKGYHLIDIPNIRILRLGQKRGSTRSLNAMI